MSDTPSTDALMAKWDDDGATRGSAFIELRDMARNLERSNKELREALEWYADSANWKRMVAGNGNRSWSRSPAMIDKGARGKFILTQIAALSAADANKGKENETRTDRS